MHECLQALQAGMSGCRDVWRNACRYASVQAGLIGCRLARHARLLVNGNAPHMMAWPAGAWLKGFSITSCLTASIAGPLQAITCLWPCHWQRLFGRGLFIGRGIFWSAAGGLAVSVLDLPSPAMPCPALWSGGVTGIWPG